MGGKGRPNGRRRPRRKRQGRTEQSSFGAWESASACTSPGSELATRGLVLPYTGRMASPQVADRLLTAEEFYEIEDPLEGGKMELIDGRVVIEMPTSGKHGARQVRVGASILAFSEANNEGEVGTEAGFLLAQDPDRVRAPDVHFVSNAMLGPGGIPEEGYIPFIPTLAVEIVSPNDLDSKVMEKVDHYLEAGVPRVWVVRPKRETVTVYRTGGLARILRAGDTLTSDDAGFVTEGFALPVAEAVR